MQHANYYQFNVTFNCFTVCSDEYMHTDDFYQVKIIRLQELTYTAI